MRWSWDKTAIAALVMVSGMLAGGCWNVPSAHTISRDYGLGDAPVDSPHQNCRECLNGGRLFRLYCGSCHNARPLSERPFSNYEVAVAHMREQAYLTGNEYRQLIHFLRRWDDIGPPTPDVPPSPKRLIFARPIPEERQQKTQE